jgi:hypothetical protein
VVKFFVSTEYGAFFMAIFTAAEIEEQITAYKAALLALATSQSYTVLGRTVTRANIQQIRDTLEWLNREKSIMAAGVSAGLQTLPGRPVR